MEEFRANDGRVGGQFEDARLLLLTTTGARTGLPRTAILGYYPDTTDRVLVVGSAGGGPKHPGWYHNLLANPACTVETGLFTYPATALVLRDAERTETFARLAAADPGWAKYQANTTRTIPVVALVSATTGPPGERTGSIADLLLKIHEAFRRELTLIRKEVLTTGATTTLGAQLRINCLKLCQGLHNHHSGESQGIFPAVLAQHPEAAETINRLQAEHDTIATLLDDLQSLLATATPAAIAPELDRLTQALLDHLAHEEAQLLPLLGG
ncbi:nitroreductase/quinone reductase family protein [Kribbella koreensis]|uniref:nitroreductase/quinone reductase family protein n=1 Tax=Kribbella koreensis TaxID=57909 RepID=UPI0031DBA7D1